MDSASSRDLMGVVDEKKVGGTARGRAANAHCKVRATLFCAPDVCCAAFCRKNEVRKCLWNGFVFDDLTDLSAKVHSQLAVIGARHDVAVWATGHEVAREKDCAKGGFGVPGRHGDEQVVGSERAFFQGVEGFDEFYLKAREFPVGVQELDESEKGVVRVTQTQQVFGGFGLVALGQRTISTGSLVSIHTRAPQDKGLSGE